MDDRLINLLCFATGAIVAFVLKRKFKASDFWAAVCGAVAGTGVGIPFTPLNQDGISDLMFATPYTLAGLVAALAVCGVLHFEDREDQS